MAVDPSYYSTGEGRKLWDPTYPGYVGNNNPMGQYWTHARATMSPEQFQAELARADESYASRPHGIASVIKPGAIIGGILAGGFAGAALTGGAGAAAAGGGAAGGGASVLPAAGAAAGAVKAGGVLGAVKDYGPLVLGGATALSGASASGKQNELMERAMRLSEQDYASRAPLREQALRMTALPPPPRPVLAQLSDPNNPYARRAG